MAAPMAKRTVLRLALMAALLPLPTGFAAWPTTAPATAPTEFPADAPARTWFNQLTSADPNEREAARDNLMGLASDQLPMLQALVAHALPLSAAQIAPLHDIVIQMYLSDERYPSEPGGFLGLRWTSDFFQSDEPLRLGVPVEVRLPGFPGYRSLRDGDMIVGVLLEPDLPLNRPPNMRTPTREDLTSALKFAGAGRRIELAVLRGGELIRVPIRLAARPMIDIGNIDALFIDRQARAEKYWQSQFLPMLSMS